MTGGVQNSFEKSRVQKVYRLIQTLERPSGVILWSNAVAAYFVSLLPSPPPRSSPESPECTAGLFA